MWAGKTVKTVARRLVTMVRLDGIHTAATIAKTESIDEALWKLTGHYSGHWNIRRCCHGRMWRGNSVNHHGREQLDEQRYGGLWGLWGLFFGRRLQRWFFLYH